MTKPLESFFSLLQKYMLLSNALPSLKGYVLREDFLDPQAGSWSEVLFKSSVFILQLISVFFVFL